jgi:hypothetical protein
VSENRDEDGRLREEVFMSEKRTSSLKMLRVRANALNSHKFLFKYHTYIYTAVPHRCKSFFTFIFFLERLALSKAITR